MFLGDRTLQAINDRNSFQDSKSIRAIADILSELFLLGFADSTQPTRSAIALKYIS
jgi:hypothetical protein